ncbi:uncharacterized protein BDW47DRAFT_101545 [Aspergillus candidus]|uniref:Uncharacterized protein n=1 Tax=Aspergillus candidus TaxID=41067 RepID=A0A2I2FHU4_ASPCN|nr:hypothetical protein BDW47DRAFT_101545 [Aspergillus candidus]PLB40184.1 hypothetical protein BDW47DRAFT_101545 [Aspergillus candidus]
MPPPTIQMEGFSLPTEILRGMERRGWLETPPSLEEPRKYVPQLNLCCTETARVSLSILIHVYYSFAFLFIMSKRIQIILDLNRYH